MASQEGYNHYRDWTYALWDLGLARVDIPQLGDAHYKNVSSLDIVLKRKIS